MYSSFYRSLFVVLCIDVCVCVQVIIGAKGCFFSQIKSHINYDQFVIGSTLAVKNTKIDEIHMLTLFNDEWTKQQ